MNNNMVSAKYNSEIEKRAKILNWGKNLRYSEISPPNAPIAKTLHSQMNSDLTNYWSLAILSRSSSKYPDLAREANKVIFRVRTIIEKKMEQSIRKSLDTGKIKISDLFIGSIFSKSIKQGLSLRLPLTSCVPTKTCHWNCYAHDGMDAGRYPIIKGAINGSIAGYFEESDNKNRRVIIELLKKQVTKAILDAEKESEKSLFDRQPRIRFSHVGELAHYPDFANTFAKLVADLSNSTVACVIYTRHPNASRLDQSLFTINFTLDQDSPDRIKWAPKQSRIVYSAWNGESSPDAEINFLEHHRFSHANASGNGEICPVTVKQLNLDTCDSAKCDLCFRKPNKV